MTAKQQKVSVGMEVIESQATGRWFEVERTDGVVVSGFAGYKRQRFGYLTEDRESVEAWVQGETEYIRES